MPIVDKISPQGSFGFKKKEHLCSKKLIDKLFAEGESFLSFPIKVVYIASDLTTKVPVQAAFTVSKKTFKRAVKRNRIKRLMREAYRLNKNILLPLPENKQLAVFFIFIGKELYDYNRIENGIKKALFKLSALHSDAPANNTKKTPE
ncbi:ribonuclease P protein component [uncultured Draconibacterium sp.]|uniref:ribonuclease P protein component n=1 Tax=uncultured Draconibacterium sp. TaxID=1573823 RepID=UPI003260AD75